MGRRQRDWAIRARQELIDDLGGRCCYCDTSLDLQINHIYGRNYSLRNLDMSARISIYKEEAKQGLINVACIKCNAVYRPIKKPKQKIISKERVPF